jgi:lipid kinase YegS
MNAPRRKRLLLAGPAEAPPPLVGQAIATLRDEGVEMDYAVCRDDDQYRRAAERASQDRFDAVVALGGDGALNGLVNGVLAADLGEDAPPLAVVPGGTANDFAAQLGLTADDPERALRLACSGKADTIDVGRANGRAFLNVASGGYGARITTETSPALKRFLGGVAYSVSGLMMAANREASPLQVAADDFAWEGAVCLFCVGNGSQTGGGFRVCPNASLTDGMFDLLVIPDMPMDQLALVAADIVQAQRVQHADVAYVQTPRITVRGDEAFQVNLDGEPTRTSEARFEVVPRALTLIMS